MAAVAITRTDYRLGARTSVARMKDARAVRRPGDCAGVDGSFRAAAAAASGMIARTCGPGHRYNAGGLDGLSDQWARDRSHVTRTQSEHDGWVELGPDRRGPWSAGGAPTCGPRPGDHDECAPDVGNWLGGLASAACPCAAASVRSCGRQAFEDDLADLVRATSPAEAAGKPVDLVAGRGLVRRNTTLTRVRPGRAHDLGPCATTATRPTCSAPSVRNATRVPPSSCRRPARRR